MPSIKKIFLVILFSLFLIEPAKSQVLDDDDVAPTTTVSKPSTSINDETAKDEALFNELFSDYSEEDRDMTKIKTFGDAMDVISHNINKKDLKTKEDIQAPKELPPLEGKLYIGITKNSFQLYQNAFNQPACSFTVTLKSDINRYIKLMSLNLVYAKGVFAFIFRNVKEGKSVTQSFRTMGNICYNLSGVPDIAIHKCKIMGAESKECAQRLEWSNKLSREDNKR